MIYLIVANTIIVERSIHADLRFEQFARFYLFAKCFFLELLTTFPLPALIVKAL